MRHQSADGQQAGLVQRLKDLTFPHSPVIDFNRGKNDISNLMDTEEQMQHDVILDDFAERRRALIDFENMLCTHIQEPWHFEVTISDDLWLPATIWQAHIDGTFDTIVLDGQVQLFRPRLVAEQLRQSQSGARDLPEVINDLNRLNMVVPASMPSRLQIAWCALCVKNVGGEPRKLRIHEEQRHPNRFPCSQCTRTFSCSDNLRKHSRSTKHPILLET